MHSLEVCDFAKGFEYVNVKFSLEVVLTSKLMLIKQHRMLRDDNIGVSLLCYRGMNIQIDTIDTRSFRIF